MIKIKTNMDLQIKNILCFGGDGAFFFETCFLGDGVFVALWGFADGLVLVLRRFKDGTLTSVDCFGDGSFVVLVVLGLGNFDTLRCDGIFDADRVEIETFWTGLLFFFDSNNALLSDKLISAGSLALPPTSVCFGFSETMGFFTSRLLGLCLSTTLMLFQGAFLFSFSVTTGGLGDSSGF